MGLVLVDLDGTLLTGAASERRFVAHLVARRRLGTAQFAQALWFALRRWPEVGEVRTLAEGVDSERSLLSRGCTGEHRL